MPRFVILEHDHPALHWDLMLEVGEVLRTWRLAAPPVAGAAVPAEPSFDHRKVYLDYQGPVSGGRGTVRRWDQGNYYPEPAVSGDDETVVVRLEGERIRGTAAIARGEAGDWSLSLDPET